MAHFSSRLFARRNRLGLSQSALAKAAGVSEGSVSAWERGLNAPQGRLLEKLASTLNVSPAWLMGGSHSDELARAPELNDRPKDAYNATSDLRMRDLMARLASMPPDARTMAFRRFDEVLIEVFALFSPPEYDGDIHAFQRDVEIAERLEKAASQRLNEGGPGKGAEPVSMDRKGGLG